MERTLPWRLTRDPWAVLVSEIMLQQTQVDRVIPAYERFLARFPDPTACADAPRADVVRAWEGLGYHRRAVALHDASRAMVSHHGGQVPDHLDELLAIKGIGPYTARAVLAFAFEHDVGVVDTNVRRVLQRAVLGTSCTTTKLQPLADALVEPGRGWAHNQAMLDFGALRCRAVPRCTGCPLRRSCRWARGGWLGTDPAAGSPSSTAVRFRGSDREARGRVLGAARAGGGSNTVVGALRDELGADRVDRAIRGLVADGLISVDADGIALA